MLNILTSIQQSGLSYLAQFLQEQSTALFRDREMPFPVAKSLRFPMNTKALTVFHPLAKFTASSHSFREQAVFSV